MSDHMDQTTFLENKAWRIALQKEKMEALEKERLQLMKAEIKRRENYVKSGEWVY
jgi:hypothetical protein